MLIRIFTCGSDSYDSLVPLDGDNFTVSLYRLPRGYSLEKDEKGKPYILCPNGEKVYDLDQSRKDSATAKFSYTFNGRRRIVRLHIDEKATHDMYWSGEDYRNL